MWTALSLSLSLSLSLYIYILDATAGLRPASASGASRIRS